ncbi:hypothetical protein [Veillonella montpellierensis]|uniref:hypothetical protein n=1 Tax=Veillonella montpellierensis TaxID=187328 RepID=UPI00138ADA1F|nr:hypothetical protein [Veillonella montpellierensis]
MNKKYMNYRLSWEPSNTKGFILASTIMAAIISFLLIGVICFCASHSIQYIEQVQSSLETMADGRYTRLFIGNRIRFSNEPSVVDSDHSMVSIGKKGYWRFKKDGWILARVMSNGVLQPISGTAVANEVTNTYVTKNNNEFVFSKNNEGIQLSWQIQRKNPYDEADLYIMGTYSVKEIILPDYYWFRSVLNRNE